MGPWEPAAMEEYVAGFVRRSATARQELAVARAEAAAAALRAAQAIRARYPSCQVWIIGSVARGRFRPGSDIDLVIEGLPADAVAEAEGLAVAAAGLPVDVLRLESLSPAWREHHRRFGRVVDGR